MSGKTFAVVFSGKVVEGASVERVKSNVAKLFKVEVAKIERLFSGARVVIKKGLDETTAKKYQMALAKAGALCEVLNAAAAAKAQQAKPQAPQQEAPVVRPAASMASSASVGNRTSATPKTSPEQPKSVVKEAPGSLGEFANVKLDAPGIVLVQHQVVAPPQLDLSGLSMDQPGATLSEHKEEAPPTVDLSGISMAEPGAEIGKAEEVKDLAVDLSGLSMDEPGTTLVEHKEVAAPQIDTSKLSVS